MPLDSGPLRVCDCCDAIFADDGADDTFVCVKCGSRLCEDCNDEHRTADEREHDECPYCKGSLATDQQLLELACQKLKMSREDLVLARGVRLAHPEWGPVQEIEYTVCGCCRDAFVYRPSDATFQCEACGEWMCEGCNEDWRSRGSAPDACPFCIGHYTSDAQMIDFACETLGVSFDELRLQSAAARSKAAGLPLYIVYDPEGKRILTETPTPYAEAKAIADELDDVLILKWEHDA